MPARAAASTRLDAAAELLDRRERRCEHLLGHARLDALGSRQLPACRSAGRRGARRVGSCTSPGMPSEVESRGSRPGRWLEEERGVGDVARERAALVERGGEGDHAVAADRAVGGLDARRSRTAPPAGGSSRRCRCRSPTARCPAATAAALPPDEPPGTRVRSHGFCDRAEAGVLVRRAHRELVLVRLAEHRHAGALQVRDARRRVRRAVALEDARAGHARHAPHAEEVLDGDGREAAGVAGRLVRDPEVRAEVVGSRAAAPVVEGLARAVARRRRSRALLRGRQAEQIVAHDAPGVGTRKPLSVASGACSRATSRGRLGRGTSSRSTLVRSTT